MRRKNWCDYGLSIFLSTLRRNANSIFVLAGEHDFSVNSGNEQLIAASQLIEHEHYDGQTFTNDIALIKVSAPLVFNDFVQTISMPAQMELVSAGTNCTTTGWGTTTEGGSIPDILRKVSWDYRGKLIVVGVV